MSDDSRNNKPSSPHLHTRPATMITAIGLCMLIMLMQLLPDIQDATARLTMATTTAGSAR